MARMVFVMGYSRSGTKLMADILERSGSVLRPTEIQFFGRLHDPTSSGRAVEVASMVHRLSEVQTEGLRYKYTADADDLQAIRARVTEERAEPVAIYRAYFEHFAGVHGKSHVCDASPRNAYYIDSLRQLFPDAAYIYMVRDPRDNTLSQRVKYRSYLGRNRLEAARLIVNYHPAAIAKMWLNSYRAVRPYFEAPNVELVRYEDLLERPGEVIGRIARLVGVAIPEEVGDVVRRDNSGKWRRGLPAAEVACVESITRDAMLELGYEPSGNESSALTRAWLVAKFALKAPLILLFNLNRHKRLLKELRLRFGGRAP